MSEDRKVIYYEDELNDDFAKEQIDPVIIDENYKYIHKNPIWNITACILYRLVVSFPAYLYSKIKFRLKVKNRKALKKVKTGYFVYINHTQEILDTLNPTIICFPKRAYIIAHPNNVSIKGLKTFNKMLGALPIPGDIKSSKNFLDAIKKKIDKGNIIAIYPESHVWPYYTKIRNFKSVSFKYPVKFNVPAYCITITYKKSKRKEPDIVAYVDGPFYPDKGENLKEAEKSLRDKIYQTMNKRSENSNIEVIKYIKKSNSTLAENKGECND